MTRDMSDTSPATYVMNSDIGGPRGIRTPDLLIANETRYQLRHGPGLPEHDITPGPRHLTTAWAAQPAERRRLSPRSGGGGGSARGAAAAEDLVEVRACGVDVVDASHRGEGAGRGCDGRRGSTLAGSERHDLRLGVGGGEGALGLLC